MESLKHNSSEYFQSSLGFIFGVGFAGHFELRERIDMALAYKEAGTFGVGITGDIEA